MRMTAEEINARYKKDQDKLIRHYGGTTDEFSEKQTSQADGSHSSIRR